MTVRELIRLLRADGWTVAGRHGERCHWKHLWKPRRATIAGGARDELAPEAARRLLQQLDLRRAASSVRARASGAAKETRDEVPDRPRTGGRELVGLGP